MNTTNGSRTDRAWGAAEHKNPPVSLTINLSADQLGALAEAVATLLPHRAPLESDPWLATAGAAEYLRVHRDTLRRLAAAGAIPSEQDAPGCKRYFRRSALDAWREAGGRASTRLPLGRDAA